MQCSFTLTNADLTALHKVIARRLTQLSHANSKLLLSNFFIWVPLGVALASYAALFRKYPEISWDLFVVAAAFCIGVALIIAGMFYRKWIYRRVLLSPESWFLAEQTVELDAGGLDARGTYGAVHYPWSSFRHLAEDGRNLYLFIDNAQAFVLPKAAVGSTEQLAQVRAWLPVCATNWQNRNCT